MKCYYGRDTRSRSRAQMELTCGTENTRISDDILVQNDPTRLSCLKQMTLASRSIQRDLHVSRESRFKQAQRETRVHKHPTRSRVSKTRQESRLQQMRPASSSTKAASFLANTRACLHFYNQFNSTLTKNN